MKNGALDRESIRQLIIAGDTGQLPLLEGFSSLSEQLQPNGVDLTLGAVAEFDRPGELGRDDDRRRLPGTRPWPVEADGWLHLAPGAYLVTFNEWVNLPLNLMALGRPRSSLLRCGVSLHTAVWDAGYQGRSQALLTVHNPHGHLLQPGVRLMQLVFFPLAGRAEPGYSGRYQGGNR